MVLQPAAGMLVQFAACPLKRIPKQFGEGRKVDLCLVYAVEAELANISLRPDDTSELITWTGKITKPGKSKAQKR